MEQAIHPTAITPEITFPHEPAANTKRIWKTFWILLILTIAELALGLSHYIFHVEGWLLLFLKGGMIIFSVFKAIYIVSIFMHFSDEVKPFRLTILIPLISFIWFILAFLWDGTSYRNLRNRYNGPPAAVEQPASHKAQKPGALD